MEDIERMDEDVHEPAADRILARILATPLEDEALSAWSDEASTMSTLLSTGHADCEDK